MKLELSGGKSPGHEGYETQQALVSLFEECLLLQARKASLYSDAWRSQGYMGNLARCLSKVTRLRNMLWREDPIENSEESTEDNMLDLINLISFMILNKRQANKWGSFS